MEAAWATTAETAAGRMVSRSSVFRFSEIEEFLRCRNQVPAFHHFHCPDKLAGRRRMPIDLNFPEGVQIFDMAFVERVSMAVIPSGDVLNRA
ncbi:hypothetical protein OLZ32_33050 [Rhizobium sp. 1AS11]|uniref:hypothetical protein n=1 Tax=Rhizobium acaciae TaxID=2989736 RepID=UPI002223E7E1|nr:hypothetical protein [Rhizobium acaciae]MCW1413041.1 hypothetical protein [Rhizobium acaciae]MCW1745193.1 hypothetical protein [Rhizobium acaciae]